MRVLQIAVLFFAAALLIAACDGTPTANNAGNAAPPPNKPVSSAPTPVADELAAAAKIYKEKCSRCHKEDGTGGKIDIEGTTIKAENLTSDKMKKMDDAEYIKILNEGIANEGMPSFKGKLSDDDMKSVVKFIRREFQK